MSGLAAEEVKIGDITYSIWEFSSGKYAEVTSPNDGSYSGHIEIPETIVYNGETYPVTSIGAYAFCYDNITSITIPNSVTEIRINAFLSCNYIEEIKIPASVEKIGVAVFKGCRALRTVVFEDSETSLVFGTQSNCKSDESFINTSVDSLYIGRQIGTDDYSNPFTGMRNTLKALKFGEKYNSNTTERFSAFTALERIELPQTINYIDEYAFRSCTALSSIIIPNKVTQIGKQAFYNCSSLTSIRLPESVTSVGVDAFSSCSSLIDLAVLSPTAYFGGYVGEGGYLFAYSNVLNDKNNVRTRCKKVAITNPYYAVIPIRQQLSSVAFQLKDIKHEQTEGSLERVEFDGKILSADETGDYVLTGLQPSQTYNLTLVILSQGQELRYNCPVQTLMPSVNGAPQKITQTGLRIELRTSEYDEAISPKALGVEIAGKTFETKGLGEYSNNGGYYGTVNLSGLIPNTKYSFIPYIIYEGGTKYYGTSSSFTTKGVSPAIANSLADATTFRCNGEHTLGNATLKDERFTFNGKDYDGSFLLLTGLDPNTSYTLTYTVTTEEGSEETSSALTFKTTDLSFTTLTPKVVNGTTAIVCAETNIADEETNVGFEWRKTEAPDVVASKNGAGYIYNGILEGRINNLNTDSYYKARPYYKSQTGKMYYGEWSGFDPSDFSYFEPTVHTYPVQETSTNYAKVKGYVMAGTDEITEQGFEYWPLGNGGSEAKRVRVEAATNADVSVVMATGLVMTAVIDGLMPGTSYCYRAFVKTVKGTMYGEEQVFATEADATGIDSARTEAVAPVIAGYYDMNGRKLDEPRKGLNIIRYSDGSTRKVVVR